MVIVSHPHGAAVACDAAAALARRNQLAQFFTGVGASTGTFASVILKRVAEYRAEVLNRVVDGVPQSVLTSLGPVELGARVASSVAQRIGVSSLRPYNAMFLAHDAVVATLPWPRKAKAVYAYEDGACLTFRRAQRVEFHRVWDLPLPHHRFIRDMFSAEMNRWPDAVVGAPPHEPDWKIDRKDEELRLATAVSVASAFTRSTLPDETADRPVIVVPYGFPVDRFDSKLRSPSQKFTVLSVGSQDLRKGTPYLLEAWRLAALRDARLVLVGRMSLSKRFLAKYQGLYEHIPYVPRAGLMRYYHDADVLAFPTLGDGFGLVIAEAMSCGTPVITTRCGGGPECIVDGENGWIVPERSIDALVETLRAAYHDRDRTYGMGRKARIAAESYDRTRAGDRFASALASLVS